MRKPGMTACILVAAALAATPLRATESGAGEPAPHAAASITEAPHLSPHPDAFAAPAAKPADPVAVALADVLAAGAEGARKADLAAARVFYAERDYTPLWVSGGGFSDDARAVIARIEDADADGLDANDYDTPYAGLGEGAAAGPAALGRAELALTLAALAYAGDAQGGRVKPSSLGGYVTAKPTRPDPADVLAALTASDDPAATLGRFNPQHPGFKALRAALAELRSGVPATRQVVIGEGPSIKPGMRDMRVADLRRRLDLVDVEGGDVELYDGTVQAAVAAFQERAGLKVDGVVGPQTRMALNGALDATAADIIVNMERWRWLPPDMGGNHYVWVNVPEYRLRVVTGGETTFETRVIVGTSDNQTPIFSDEIEYVDVNPYWNVPRSIAVKEMLPAAQQDPYFFERRGIQVLYNYEGRTVIIDPRSIDWWQWNAANMPFRFRQPPGGANALGRVKFMFPNEHAVYLHDTPTRHLFDRAVRAFSHGCVRAENPLAFADALLAFEDSMTGERIKRLIGGENGTLRMKRHVPVHLTYFTVWVDGTGEIQRRPDIYGHDARLKAALGLDGDDETRSADLALDGKLVP